MTASCTDTSTDILQDKFNSLVAWEKKWGMAFHPEKCSAIRLTWSRNPVSSAYTLKGHTYFGHRRLYKIPQCRDAVKHVLELSYGPDNQESKQHFRISLRHNLQVSNEETKSTAYFSMVIPILQYCSTVWSPYTKDYIYKIEMVQRRAAMLKEH